MFNNSLESAYNVLIEGRHVKPTAFNRGVTKVSINDKLNSLSLQNRDQYSSEDKKLIKLFFDATKQILNEKYRFN